MLLRDRLYTHGRSIAALLAIKANSFRKSRDYIIWAADTREPIHARGVYPTQDTSRMGTVRRKRDEEETQEKHKKVGNMEAKNVRLHEWNKSDTQPGQHQGRRPHAPWGHGALMV